jgi:hypothetical protein
VEQELEERAVLAAVEMEAKTELHQPQGMLIQEVEVVGEELTLTAMDKELLKQVALAS